jgi:probable F420-dependent oxidoreductase
VVPEPLKVRLSVGLGAWAFGNEGAAAFWRFVDHAEALRLDSLWLSDRPVSPVGSRGFVLDPLVALAGVAARTRYLKLGTSIYVLPLRNPVLAAKELATLDFLSSGRMLLAVGVGNEETREYTACGVPKTERGGRLDEAIGLLRRLWREPEVTHTGRYYQLDRIVVDPKPPGPLPIWLGGRSEAAFRRIGQLCDGWLPSATRPAEITEGIDQIQNFAAAAGRAIEPDHFGAVLTYCVANSYEQALQQAAPFLLRRRADVPPEEFAALGTLDDCVSAIRRYVAAGASKFVLRPAGPTAALLDQLDALADLQQAFTG